MGNLYKLNRLCILCGCKIIDQNKSGYCNKHRPRTGENNPFYGHKQIVSDETRKKLSENSKQQWQSPEYRQKMTASQVGQKRTQDFKNIQAVNAKKQFEDHNQRVLRSKVMKQTWQDGKMVNSKNSTNYNKSKKELQLFANLQKHFQDSIIQTTIKYTDALTNKWLYPDMIIFEDTVIEFNGNYWHANPRQYEDNFVIKGSTAAEIRRSNNKRYDKLNELGYSVIVIWESAFTNNEQRLTDELIRFLDWDNHKEIGVYEIF